MTLRALAHRIVTVLLYRGRIYATEIARGLDVFALRPSRHLSQNEIDAAMRASVDEFNAQQQQRFTWPAASVVARAYVDQLTRTHALDARHAAALRALLNRADRLRPRDGEAADVLSQLEVYAAQFDSGGAAVNAIDRSRLRALAETVRGISAARRAAR